MKTRSNQIDLGSSVTKNAVRACFFRSPVGESPVFAAVCPTVGSTTRRRPFWPSNLSQKIGTLFGAPLQLFHSMCFDDEPKKVIFFSNNNNENSISEIFEFSISRIF